MLRSPLKNTVINLIIFIVDKRYHKVYIIKQLQTLTAFDDKSSSYSVLFGV